MLDFSVSFFLVRHEVLHFRSWVLLSGGVLFDVFPSSSLSDLARRMSVAIFFFLSFLG